ncbi:MAG: alanine racemase [Clostridia bacterium]
MFNFQRRAWIEIDLDAVKHNYLEIKKHTNSKICCVIKADGYGHGSVPLARLYEELGASFFAVSNIDEALKLRESGIKTPILNLGYAPPKDVKIIEENNISQCLYSLDYANVLAEECEKQQAKIKIHIKVDTGMSRLGFFCQDTQRDFSAIKEIKKACSYNCFIKEGIFTHFAVSDEGTDEFTNKQLENFLFVIDSLSDIKFELKHCANSAGIIDFKTAHFDMVRAGIIIYGLMPSFDIRNKIDLRPVLSFKTIVSHVKTIESNSSVSYGRTFSTDKKIKIATVPVGYADGYTRILAQSDTDVLIAGKRRKIIGRICMDQMMILLEDTDDVKIGDVVVLIGNSENERISTEEIAMHRDTINYEVVCDIATRVPRIYLKNNVEVII